MARWCKRYLLVCGALLHVMALVLLVQVLRHGPGEALRDLRAEAAHGQAALLAVLARIERRRAARMASELGLALPPAAFSYRIIEEPLAAPLGSGRVLSVGPGRELATPSAAAAVARNGDIIEIAAGQYRGDSAMWRASDLLIRAVGGIAHINGEGVRLIQDKALWLIRGNNIRIENIEFSHSRSTDSNGAGMRVEADGLLVLGCYFHDNETGILSNPLPDGTLRVEFSEFARNGHANGQAHQIYINAMREFTLRFSYLHDTVVGSAVKSRAQNTHIEFNRILDGRNGSSNYAVDLSNGGTARLLGNLIEHGPHAGNGVILAFAAEHVGTLGDALFVVHNTLVNDRHAGVFLANHGVGRAYMYNNLLIGHGRIVRGEALVAGNVAAGRGLWDNKSQQLGGIQGSGANRSVAELSVLDRAAFDYRLAPGAVAIDAGRRLEADSGLIPAQEYRHPLSAVKRRQDAAPDAGALEFNVE